MLEVLGQAALRTLLLAAIVQLGLMLFRVKRPYLRSIAWTIVLAASLAMPALQWATPLRLSVLPNLSGAALTEAAEPQPQTSVSQAFMPARAEDATTPTTVMPWLEALYLLVCGILLLRLSVGIFLSLRLVSKAAPIHPAWAANTHIRISRDVTAPVTVANVILLPPDIVTWPPAMREAVLAHERAHVARWDFAMLLVSQINQAVFWFSPLSWWLHRRLATLAELASDDLAMEATGDRPNYAEVLLEMGRRSGPLLRGLAMARPATLKHRIERVLSDHVPAACVRPHQQVMLAVGAASISVIAASSHPGSAPSLTAPPPLARVSPAGQEQPPRFADLAPSPSALAEQEVSEPVPVQGRRTAFAFEALPQPAPVAWPARPSNPVVRHGAAQPAWRPATRNTLPPALPRTVAQRVKAERGPGAFDVPLRAGGISPVGSAPHSNDGHGTTDNVGVADPDGRTFPAVPKGQRLASEVRLLQRADEPHCTGVYYPRPGGPRTDGQDELIQAKYSEASDGMPWLRLSFGSRAQARLTGIAVERTSVRTTVVAALPRDTNHMTGTTHGAHGTVNFECVRPNAHP